MSKLGLASEWRLEEGGRKSDSCSTESKQRLTKVRKTHNVDCVKKLIKV